MIATKNKTYHYVDYKAMGAHLMQLREAKYGKRSRSEFVRILNEHGNYRWDQSAYRKCELGIYELTLDRLCEVCMALGVYPTQVIMHCTYGNK